MATTLSLTCIAKPAFDEKPGEAGIDPAPIGLSGSLTQKQASARNCRKHIFVFNFNQFAWVAAVLTSRMGKLIVRAA